MSTAPRRGLGRGLGALLGDAPVPTAPIQPQTPGAEVVRQVPVDRITPNPQQPRKTFDDAALDELAASIAEHGVLVPILVRERADGYELIAGERRWRASAKLQKATVPAVVRKSDERESLEVAIIENLQRENLNPLEEAAGIAQLIDSHDYTQEEVAKRLGKARPSISNALRMLALPEHIKAMIADGRLSAGHAKVILGAPEPMQGELAARVSAQGLSVRALERVIAQLNEPVVVPEFKPRAIDPNDAEFERRLRERFGTAVALKRASRGGAIEIKYGSEQDLLRIADLLLGEE
ncbi:MAG TPA: ParB/RepB/Spo0J family partition protein [Candidatus Baltobacteraceae bacterium]|nr:ParB/RepB/Spo0J family partition protein [Candidatus Baltobacteraceae bacterium]